MRQYGWAAATAEPILTNTHPPSVEYLVAITLFLGLVHTGCRRAYYPEP